MKGAKLLPCLFLVFLLVGGLESAKKDKARGGKKKSKKQGVTEAPNGSPNVTEAPRFDPYSLDDIPKDTLIVTSILGEPFLQLREDDGNVSRWGNDAFDGYIPDLLAALFEKVGFKYAIRLVPDQAFGAIDENGSWTGMIGEVVDRRADVAAAPLTVTERRMRAVDFSRPFLVHGQAPVVVLRKPHHIKPSIFDRFLDLLRPFTYTVWYTVVIAYVVVGTVLYIISYVNPYEWRKLARDGLATIREKESFTCMNTFWYLFSTIMWQGYVRTPRSIGGRIVSLVWWIFVVLFLVTYTASLTNQLRYGPHADLPFGYTNIKEFDDLGRQRSVKFSPVSGGSTEHLLKSASDHETKQIWEAIQRSDTKINTIKEGIDKVRHSNGKFGFIMESAMARYWADQDPCDLMVVGDQDLGAANTYALAFPQGSKHRDSIDMALLSLRGEGKMKSLSKQWFTGVCDFKSGSATGRDYYQEFHPVGIGSFSGALLVVAAGVILGLLVTIVEFLIYRWAESPDEEDKKALAGNRESDV